MFIYKITVITSEIFVSNNNVHFSSRHQSRLFFNLRKFLGHYRANSRIHDCAMLYKFSILKPVVCNTICAIKLCVEFIITELKAYELKNEQTCGKANC